MVNKTPYILAAAAIWAGCTSKLDTNTSSGSSPATEQAQGETVAGTSTLVIPAIDLDGLKTVTIDVGPLKGFSVQTVGGAGAASDLTVKVTPEADFPMAIAGDQPLGTRLRIGLPDALLQGIDLAHPESIAVYAHRPGGEVFLLPPEDVSVEASRLFVVIDDYLSLVVVQSRPPLAVGAPAAGAGAPTLRWSVAPVGAAPLYDLRILRADCSTLVQKQTTSAREATVSPPLPPGDYCVRIFAEVDGGTLADAGGVGLCSLQKWRHSGLRRCRLWVFDPAETKLRQQRLG